MTPIPILLHGEERYVLAKDLYSALDLSPANYANNLKSWFTKEYLFQGKLEFSTPVPNYDYVVVPEETEGTSSVKSIAQVLAPSDYTYYGSSQITRGRPSHSYLIRLEFAKLIALDSNSKFKKQFVQWLLSLEAQLNSGQLMSRSVLLGLMEMVKLCTYIDNQLAYYKSHKDAYFEFKQPEDGWDEFDKWRNSVLRLLTDAELTELYIKLKDVKPSKGMTKIEKYAVLDALESIRSSLFDFLAPQIQLTKAKDLSSFVKELFKQAGVTQFDFKPKGYSPNGQLDLFREIQQVDVKLVSDTLRELKPAL
jgi:hypothetical protein